MVDARVETRWRTHAWVECRRQGERWWLYARPALEPDARFDSILCGQAADAAGLGPLCGRGVPADASITVRDEYTWRVAGTPDAHTRAGDEDILSSREAEQWLARGASRRWTAGEPVARITDPRWENPTWLSPGELDELLMHFEWVAGEPPPATHCALADMCRALEQEYMVRVVMWTERREELSALQPREQARRTRHAGAELELARARVRRPAGGGAERRRDAR